MSIGSNTLPLSQWSDREGANVTTGYKRLYIEFEATGGDIVWSFVTQPPPLSRRAAFVEVIGDDYELQATPAGEPDTARKMTRRGTDNFVY